MIISRRNALIAGMTTPAALGAAACARETPETRETNPTFPSVVSNLGGLVANAHDFGITAGEQDQSRLFQDAIDFAHQQGLALYCRPAPMQPMAW